MVHRLMQALSALTAVAAAMATATAMPARIGAQSISSADSALVARLLLAEDRRDTSQAAYDEGLRSGDSRIRDIARRGLARSRDPRFADRDSIGPRPAKPPKYDDPAWRLRYRQLGNRNDNCDELAHGLTDSAWAVRLRAADLLGAACAADTAAVDTLRGWTRNLPANSARRNGGVSWHTAAHGLLALTRVMPAEARAALSRFTSSNIWHVRVYAARAAAALNDTAALIRLAGDRDDNVREAAISALARVAGHTADATIVPALATKGYQAVRAAAVALRDTPLRKPATDAAIASAIRLRRDSSETSRDARRAVIALLASVAAPGDWPQIKPLTADFDCVIAAAIAELGRTLGDATATPSCSPLPVTLPQEAVRLAMGGEARLRVTLADSSGGGSFVVRLRGDVAPIMAARVVELARRGYYNGLTWHRVEPDFVIQGFSPGASEYIGYPRFFSDELGAVPHVRGTVGMSTRGHDTGDAQWFVNLSDNLRLNRDYTVFAEVSEGINVVDGVLEGDVVAKVEVLPP